MYLVGWLAFPDFGEVAFVGDIQGIPAVLSPMVIRAVCSRGALYVGPYAVGWLLWVVW